MPKTYEDVLREFTELGGVPEYEPPAEAPRLRAHKTFMEKVAESPQLLKLQEFLGAASAIQAEREAIAQQATAPLYEAVPPSTVPEPLAHFMDVPGAEDPLSLMEPGAGIVLGPSAKQGIEALKRMIQGTRSPKVAAMVEDVLSTAPGNVPLRVQPNIPPGFEREGKTVLGQYRESMRGDIPAEMTIVPGQVLGEAVTKKKGYLGETATGVHEGWHHLWRRPAEKGGFSAAEREAWVDAVKHSDPHPKLKAYGLDLRDPQEMRLAAEETLTSIQEEMLTPGAKIRATPQQIGALQKLTGDDTLFFRFGHRLADPKTGKLY